MPTRVTLVPVDAMPHVPGLFVPDDVYWILDRPTPLLGMVRPTDATPWSALFSLGVRRVACLTDDVPPYDPKPLSFACAVKLQDLYGGIAPTRPTDEAKRIEIAVAAVVDACRRGEGVVVHCAGGTGRTGTVLAAALATLGIPMADAIGHLEGLHRRRGRSWPESPWQREFLARRDARLAPTARA